MPHKTFKIYDGRTNFWQWDTGQKLIVLDENVIEVHFSNKDMAYSVKRDVYRIGDMRVCDVPNIVLQSAKNLIAYAYVSNNESAYTIDVMRFAVMPRQKPSEYIIDPNEQVDTINRRINALEIAIKDIEAGQQTLVKFESVDEAKTWAKETKHSGIMVAIHIDSKWVAYMVEDDYSVVPVCDGNGDIAIIKVIDGGEGY